MEATVCHAMEATLWSCHMLWRLGNTKLRECMTGNREWTRPYHPLHCCVDQATVPACGFLSRHLLPLQITYNRDRSGGAFVREARVRQCEGRPCMCRQERQEERIG
jgi:hypothetical protein